MKCLSPPRFVLRGEAGAKVASWGSAGSTQRACRRDPPAHLASAPAVCLQASRWTSRGKKIPILTGPVAFARSFPVSVLAQSVTSIHSYGFEIVL